MIMQDKQVYIASGAGFSGDRFDAAVPLVQRLSDIDAPRYLIFEVLAERTIAVAHKLKQKNPDAGYSPYLEHYLRPILKQAVETGITIISNLGAANPAAAATQIHRLSAELGIAQPKIAVVTGDDVVHLLDEQTLTNAPVLEGNSVRPEHILSANAYLGARPVAQALSFQPDIVIVGRTTDSALVLGPLIHEFGWAEDAYDHLAAGTICGHLLECGAQLSGAYFADPGFKDVPHLDRVGFPFATVSANGHFTLSKPQHTGGMVTRATVTEQLLYEMHDPACYIVPDVIADVTQLQLEERGKDEVRVSGIKGHPPPPDLKVTICMEAGYLAEAEMSYNGPNGYARASLAAEIVRNRLSQSELAQDLRVDIIGAHSTLDGGVPDKTTALSHTQQPLSLPFDGDYRVRLALLSDDRDSAQLVYDELQSLYCSGPAAGGGFRGSVTEQLSSASVLLPKTTIEPYVTIEKSEGR